MNTNRPDLTEVLKDELEWHVQQVEKINLALAALSGAAAKATRKPRGLGARPTHGVPWTAKVMEIFNAEPDKAFDTNEIRDKLVERGVVEAQDNKNRPTIYSTLVRGVTKGELEKAAHGKYRKKKKTKAQDVLGLLT